MSFIISRWSEVLFCQQKGQISTPLSRLSGVQQYYNKELIPTSSHLVLRDLLNHSVSMYLDDILIFSPDPETHQRHVRQVLQHLLQHHLYVKAERCKFHSSAAPTS